MRPIVIKKTEGDNSDNGPMGVKDVIKIVRGLKGNIDPEQLKQFMGGNEEVVKKIISSLGMEFSSPSPDQPANEHPGDVVDIPASLPAPDNDEDHILRPSKPQVIPAPNRAINVQDNLLVFKIILVVVVIGGLVWYFSDKF